MISLQEAFRYAAEQFNAGNHGEAEKVYCRIIAEHEDHATALLALGTLYACCNAPGRAITFLKRGLQREPNHAGALANLGAVYRTLGKKDLAMECNQRALGLSPKDHNIMSNISGLYVNAGEPEKAIYWADKALQIEPDMPEATNHKAIAFLEQGKYSQGWALYDARLGVRGFHRRPYDCPMWDGKPVKRLAIHGEQGLGDEIMFLTCVEQLRGRFEELAIEVSPRLVSLMRSSFPWAKVFGSHAELVADFHADAYCPMGTLPRFCWPAKPNTYLKPSVTYAPVMGSLCLDSRVMDFTVPRRRVGLSWYGGTQLTHRELRNTVVDDWKEFLDFDAEFISLQYGEAGVEAETLGIPHDAEAIADLDKLAAMIKSCDLVISVCNTTIHMAGALGVPCLILTPKAAAWRYGLKGEKMVWYDSPRMIRQQPGESWKSVIQRAKVRCADYGLLPRTEQEAA
jgi:hypothetical protein